MSGAVDRGGSVRPGEELDAAAVTGWLRGQGVTLEGEPRITQFSGGASNWTYRLEYANRDLILRRPPAGTKAKSAHDMGREFRVQSALKPVYPAVPTMVGLCTDPGVLGAEFYVMDRIAGIIPRKNLPDGVQLSREQTRQLCRSFLDKLIELHQVDIRAAGLESLGKGAGYTRRQVEGWCDRFEKARTWNVLPAKRLRRWLKSRAPEDAGLCLVHNDWRLDNVVLDAADPTRVIGVLDWEMATIGDPLMDLANVITYWTEAGDGFIAQAIRRQPTHLPGMFTRHEVLDYYLTRMNLRASHWPFYEAFGLFRLAVIVQQIYYRYHHGQTRNPAFRRYGLMANYLLWRAQRVMQRARG
ncbi:MAG TPA: phosphotransferase family protein [Nevskiaceae bacterium]|nr:phosphotransferase family protein [Nevskiaceae bacterium]